MEFHSSIIPSINSIKSLEDLKPSLDEIRRSMKFQPTIWGDYFLSYDSDKTEITVDEHEALAEQKKMVTKLLAKVPDDSTYKMELIDVIQQLGVDYHFQKQIDESLQIIHDNYTEHNSKDNDLHTVALRFRLLRQAGYNVPCDVFNKFIKDNGDFAESLDNNFEGLLSLYEAAHLGTHGDEILDKAIEFCSSRLHTSLQDMSNVSLSKRVEEALKMPIRKSLTRLQARKFILMYEEDESHDQTILNFAKLDFNIVQKVHQRELHDATRWWKSLEVADKMPYARDRIVELFFWMMGVYFEPHYATARRILIKIIATASILDDTYEYSTLNELQILTDAIQRWDPNLVLEDSPPNIQKCYKMLVDACAEAEDEMGKVGRAYFVEYLKQEVKKVVRAYFEEAKWLYNDYVPTVEEYMKVSLVTSGYMLLSTSSLVGMGDQVTKQDFDWITNEPLIVRASTVIGRLMDDLVGDEYEHNPTAVHCYMKQYGVSKEEACGELREQVKNAWKDINEECLEPRPASMEILMRIVNLARIIDLLYANDDGYTDPTKSKEWVKMVFVDPIVI